MALCGQRSPQSLRNLPAPGHVPGASSCLQEGAQTDWQRAFLQAHNRARTGPRGRCAAISPAARAGRAWCASPARQTGRRVLSRGFGMRWFGRCFVHAGCSPQRSPPCPLATMGPVGSSAAPLRRRATSAGTLWGSANRGGAQDRAGQASLGVAPAPGRIWQESLSAGMGRGNVSPANQNLHVRTFSVLV